MNKSRGYVSMFTLLILIMCFAPVMVHAAGDEIIKKGELLTLQRCLEIALKRQPNIIAAMNNVSAANSRIGEAKSGYFPQIALSAGYNRVQSSSGSTGRSASGSSQSFDQYTSTAALNQTIYDFGKTSTQVRIQTLGLDSAGSDLETTTVQIFFNVKQSYYGVLQAKKNKAVAEETVKQFEQHLEQSKGFYEVGTKPKFDVTKAEVDLSNAKLNMIRSDNALKLAVVNLNNAMGVPESPEYILEDNLSFVKYNITLDGALSKAYENRPDMKSIVLKRKAAEESVSLSKKGFFPVLTGNASYNWTGEKISNMQDGWNIGAAVSFPLFSGFLTKYQVEEARANLDVLKANEESQKQTVFLDVQQAFLNLREAEDRVPVAEISVKQATENLDIANGRYAAGVGSPVEVTDAQVSYTNAKTAYIQALSDYKVAQASLEKAMGAR